MAEITVKSDDVSSKKKPGQWKVIAVLAAVLVLLNLAGGSDTEDEPPSELSDAAKNETLSPETTLASTRRQIQWPVVPSEFLMSHNPFRPDARQSPDSILPTELLSGDSAPAVSSEIAPAGTVAIAQADSPTARSTVPLPTNLVGKPVRMVFRSARGTAAMIGDKIYHEGDRIEEYEVAAIAKSGVTLRLSATPRSGTSANPSVQP